MVDRPGRPARSPAERATWLALLKHQAVVRQARGVELTDQTLTMLVSVWERLERPPDGRSNDD